MERIYRKYREDRPYYLFHRKYYVAFLDTNLALGNSISVKTDLSVSDSVSGPPHVTVKPLTACFLRQVSTGPFPQTIRFESPNLGLVSYREGYAVADMGPLYRIVNGFSLHMSLEAECLVLKLKIEAGPAQADAKQSLTEEQRKSIEMDYLFGIPFADVPEVLNMDEETRRSFSRACKDHGASK